MSAAQRAAARLRGVMLAARTGSGPASEVITAPQIAPFSLQHGGANNDTCRRRRALATTSGNRAAAAAAPDLEAAAEPTAPAATSVFVPRRSVALTGHDVGLYYPIDPPRLLAEALRALHQAGYAPRPAALARRAGCRSLQQELEATSDASALGGGGGGGAGGGGAKQGGGGGKKQQQQDAGGAAAAASTSGSSGSGSGTAPPLSSSSPLARPPALMYRRCVHDLRQALELGQGPSRVLLEGPAGCGKSLALAALVEWARQQQPGAGGGGAAAAAGPSNTDDDDRGWVALYVPSAAALTSGGFFERRPDDGTYDTLLSAQAVLRGAAEAHADVLARMPRRWVGAAGGGGGAAPAAPAAAHEEAVRAAEEAAGVPRGDKATLMDLVDAGLRADVDEARRAVECVLSLVRELGRAATLGAGAAAAEAEAGSSPSPSSYDSSAPLPRVLIAIDDYNALHWRTGYGRTVFVEGRGGGGTSTGAAPGGGGRYLYREAVPPEALNLVRGLRLMGGSSSSSSSSSAALTPLLLGPHARVVAATTASRGAGAEAGKAAAAEALAGGGGRYSVPRLTEAEVAHALHHYYERGMLGSPPSATEVRKMAALTSGNGAELRRLSVELTAVDAADGFA